MSDYRCDWCKAEITRNEKMVSISLLEIKRRPKRWTAQGVFFDSGTDELTLHTDCFSRNAERIARFLFPMGAESPKKRVESPEFPMWID